MLISNNDKFFVVEMNLFSIGREGKFRLFRPNIPATEDVARWFHCKVPCTNPEELVKARPDKIVAYRYYIRPWLWIFDGDYGVWIARTAANYESDEYKWFRPPHGPRDLPLGWFSGPYNGKSLETDRSPLVH